jgi:hypothetical protein
MRSLFSTLLLVLILAGLHSSAAADVNVYVGAGFTRLSGSMTPGGRVGEAYRFGVGVNLCRGVELIAEGTRNELATNRRNGTRIQMYANGADLALCLHPGQNLEKKDRMDFTVGLVAGLGWITNYKSWVGEPTSFYGSTSARASLIGVTTGFQLKRFFLEARYVYGAARDRDVAFIPLLFGFYF